MAEQIGLLIQSHDRYADLATLDPGTGRLMEEFDRHSSAAEGHPGPVRGHFARIGGHIAVLYRQGGALWLRIGDQLRNLDAGVASVRWETVGPESHFSLLDGTDEVISVRYRPEDQMIAWDPTPFVEEEHFDFGQFVTNVLSDSGRRDRIYTRQGD